MKQIPVPQEIYRHFKGNLYQIITLAENSETGECMVVYQALYAPFQVYVRPLEMFMSQVDRKKYPDAKQNYRFEPVQKFDAGTIVLDENCVDDVCDDATSRAAESLEEPALDPLVWEFLDADSHEKRLNILAALHHRITDDMITTMAVACDIEVPEGNLEERYSQLKNCLLMLDRFEIKRK